MCCLFVVIGILSFFIMLVNVALAAEEDETEFETDEDVIDDLNAVKVPLVIALTVTLIFTVFTIATICIYYSMVSSGYQKTNRKKYLGIKGVDLLINTTWIILTLIASPSPAVGASNAIISFSLASYCTYLVYKVYALKQDYFIVSQFMLTGG
jgi:hypothetical protein